MAISAVASELSRVSAKVEGKDVIICCEYPLPKFITIKLSGIRMGCAGVRFQECSKDQLDSNDRFWAQQFTS